MTEDQLSDLEYQFKVVYTFDNSTKSGAHIQFIHPGSEQATAIKSVLLKYKLADDDYPHKPGRVVELVQSRSGRSFTTNNHVQAWRFFKARPKSGAKQPNNTNKDFCIYHMAHRDYTYSEKWVDLLVKTVSDEAEFANVKSVKV